MAVTPHELACEMPFAKVVSTTEGDALMIAGRVYHVRGPSGNESDVFASALRQLARGDSTSGSLAGNILGGKITATETAN